MADQPANPRVITSINDEGLRQIIRREYKTLEEYEGFWQTHTVSPELAAALYAEVSHYYNGMRGTHDDTSGHTYGHYFRGWVAWRTTSQTTLTLFTSLTIHFPCPELKAPSLAIFREGEGIPIVTAPFLSDGVHPTYFTAVLPDLPYTPEDIRKKQGEQISYRLVFQRNIP